MRCTAAGDSMEPKKRGLVCLPVLELASLEEPEPSISMSLLQRFIEIHGNNRRR